VGEIAAAAIIISEILATRIMDLALRLYSLL